MTSPYLEHANITVKDPDTSAQLFCRLFGWTIRWSGEGTQGGYTVHVGSDTSYLALYTQDGVQEVTSNTYANTPSMNHLGIVVDDLDAIEKRVIKSGLTPTSHQDYNPGRRFYFDTPDNIEIEVVSYQADRATR